MKLLIVANNSRWQSWNEKIKQLNDWFNLKIKLETDLVHTDFSDIPFIQYVGHEQGFLGVDNIWYDKNITPSAKGYDIVLLVLPVSQWKITNKARGWRTDKDEGVVELQIGCDENENIYYPNGKISSAFFEYARHEILHALFMLTDKKDTTHYWWDKNQLDEALNDISYMTLKDFKLFPPIDGFRWDKNISQLFGVNSATYTSKFGIPGHNGLDIIIPGSYDNAYGTPILAAHTGIVLAISLDQSRTKGAGVLLQCKLDDDTVIQTIYWHLSEVLVKTGDNVNVGQPIGRMGNSGFVFPEPSESCKRCGTHLHFALSLFRNGKPLFTDYGNFVDPTPYLYKEGDKLPMRFNWDLFIGLRGDTVAGLQTLLKLEGFAEDYIPTGYFGPKTKRDVILLQKKLGITPFWGYVGKKTRAYLNEKYAIIN